MTGLLDRARGLFIAAAVGTLVSCGNEDTNALATEQPQAAPKAQAVEPVETPSRLQHARKDAGKSTPLDLASGHVLDVWEPERAADGFTLILAHRRHPVLLAMDGGVAHAWPRVTARDRARLLPNGDLLVVDTVGRIARYSWDGELLWRFVHGGEGSTATFPHHDVILLRNGSILAIWKEGREDVLLEIDESKSIVWRWTGAPYLEDLFADRITRGAMSHFNSLQELPPNKWHDAGDMRFKPGNILVSARNLSTVFVIDRQSGDVVWSQGTDIDRQHEASMIPKGFAHAGEIQVFDNRYEQSVAPGGKRYSRVITLDPATHQITWSYESERLYSATVGVQQPLSNGNVFIASTGGRRLFEVARDGRIVWQLIMHRAPVRPSRYAPDYAPQLALLPTATKRTVRSKPGRHYVDRSLHLYADARELRRLKKGKPGWALRSPNGCRRVYVPAQPTLSLGFGVMPSNQNFNTTYRFIAEFETEDELETVVLVDHSLTASSDPVRGLATPEIAELASRWGTICLKVAAADGRMARFRGDRVYWNNPSFRSSSWAPPPRRKPEAPDPRELKMDLEHLRALGYIQ